MLPGCCRLRCLLLVFIVWLAAGCAELPAGPEILERISISCEWANYPLIASWVAEYGPQHPEIEFDVSAGDACQGAGDVSVGGADIGLVSSQYLAEAAGHGLFTVPAAQDAALLMVNCRNPVLKELDANGFSREVLHRIFLDADLTSWEELSTGMWADVPIHVYTRADTCSTAAALAEFLGGRQQDMAGIGVYGDLGLLEAIASDPLGIGYVTLAAVHSLEGGLPKSGVQVVPLDVDADGHIDPKERLQSESEIDSAITQGEFPTPPAWELYLVFAGKPTGRTAGFIRWILTEGQAVAADAGYVALSQAQQAYGLKRLGRWQPAALGRAD